MYRVEFFSDLQNSWCFHSSHRNIEYAEIHYDLLCGKELKVRIIHEGKIILQN